MTGRRLVACATAAPVVVVAAYWLGSTAAPTATPPPRPLEPAIPSPPGAPADPVASATGWFEAVHTLSWRDRSPTAWVDRSRPYTTEPLAHAIGALADGGTGSTWTELVDGCCTQRVHDLGGVIPREAPAPPDVVYGQSDPTPRSDTPTTAALIAATVEVRRDADSTWRVTNQPY